MREHQSYGGAAFLSGMDGRDEVRELRIFKFNGWEGERRKSGSPLNRATSYHRDGDRPLYWRVVGPHAATWAHFFPSFLSYKRRMHVGPCLVPASLTVRLRWKRCSVGIESTEGCEFFGLEPGFGRVSVTYLGQHSSISKQNLFRPDFRLLPLNPSLAQIWHPTAWFKLGPSRPSSWPPLS